MCQVQSLNHIIKDTTVTTVINKFNTTVTTVNNTDVSYTQTDELYTACNDLVNQQFKSWYCKNFYKLGRDKVLRLASTARADGKNPRLLFSYLIKQELKNMP